MEEMGFSKRNIAVLAVSGVVTSFALVLGIGGAIYGNKADAKVSVAKLQDVSELEELLEGDDDGMNDLSSKVSLEELGQKEYVATGNDKESEAENDSADLMKESAAGGWTEHTDAEMGIAPEGTSATVSEVNTEAVVGTNTGAAELVIGVAPEAAAEAATEVAAESVPEVAAETVPELSTESATDMVTEVITELPQLEAEAPTEAEVTAEVVSYPVYAYNQVDFTISDEDYYWLIRIVEAEASDQDDIGKILVANVIFNRVRSGFGATVKDVIFSHRGSRYQFQPVKSGRVYDMVPSQNTIDCVGRAMAGEDYSQGALYFTMRTSSYSWFNTELRLLFVHGDHYFYN